MKSRWWPPVAAFFLLAASVLPFGMSTAQAQTPATYLALGDSLAFGVGGDSPALDGYVALTENGLTAGQYKDRGIDLLNLSVPGATSADLLAPGGQLERAKSEIEFRGDVEIITVSIGANDLLALANAESPCATAPSGQECQEALGNTLAALQTNVSTFLHELRDAAPNARIFALDIYNPYSGIGGDQELIASVGVQQVNGVITGAVRDPKLDAILVSIHDVFEGRGSQWIAPDGIHPNNNGYRVIAEAVLAAIEGRQPVIPEDLLATPRPTINPNVAPEDDGSGVSVFVPAIGIPAAFIAGGILSAAYFGMRGRH